MKKISLVIVFLMILVFAGCDNQDKGSEEGLKYLLTEDGLGYIVSGYEGSRNAVNIPSYYNELPVTEIASQAFDYTNILSLTFGSNIKEIGWYGLSKSLVLEKISVAENNQYYQAIDGVLFNKDLTSLVKFPANKNSEIYNIPSSCTNIDYFAFYETVHLKKVIIPSSIEKIDSSAFKECRSLEEVVLSGNIHTIGSFAFDNCGRLKTIILPSTLTFIGEYAFSKCTSLTTITIPLAVTTIEANAFRNCSKLTIYMERTKPGNGEALDLNVKGYKVVWAS